MSKRYLSGSWYKEITLFSRSEVISSMQLSIYNLDWLFCSFSQEIICIKYADDKARKYLGSRSILQAKMYQRNPPLKTCTKNKLEKTEVVKEEKTPFLSFHGKTCSNCHTRIESQTLKRSRAERKDFVQRQLQKLGLS